MWHTGTRVSASIIVWRLFTPKAPLTPEPSVQLPHYDSPAGEAGPARGKVPVGESRGSRSSHTVGEGVKGTVFLYAFDAARPPKEKIITPYYD